MAYMNQCAAAFRLGKIADEPKKWTIGDTEVHDWLTDGS